MHFIRRYWQCYSRWYFSSRLVRNGYLILFTTAMNSTALNHWKVIIRGTGADEQAIAWIVPNSQDATGKRLDQYLVTVDELEKVTGETIPIADYAKHEELKTSWQIPIGCNESWYIYWHIQINRN